jgi:hypothetical protein
MSSDRCKQSILDELSRLVWIVLDVEGNEIKPTYYYNKLQVSTYGHPPRQKRAVNMPKMTPA